MTYASINTAGKTLKTGDQEYWNEVTRKTRFRNVHVALDQNVSKIRPTMIYEQNVNDHMTAIRNAAHLEGIGFRTLWVEECLAAPEYIGRHGHQQNVGPLARAVHPGHLVQLSTLKAQNGSIETECYLAIKEIRGFAPLDNQFGAHPKKSVPEVLREPLFGIVAPTEVEVEQHGSVANVPSMKTYAILDAAKVLHLPLFLANSGLKFRCLFKGETADKLKNVAPYLVELEENSAFTRDIFTSAGMASNMWDLDPGIYIRSRANFDDIWRHFRKFTRIKNEKGKWFLFRFWEGATLGAYFEKIRENLNTVWCWEVLYSGRGSVHSICVMSNDMHGPTCTRAIFECDRRKATSRNFILTEEEYQALNGAKYNCDLEVIASNVFEAVSASKPSLSMQESLEIVRECAARFRNFGFTRMDHIYTFSYLDVMLGEGFERKDPEGTLFEICVSEFPSNQKFGDPRLGTGRRTNLALEQFREMMTNSGENFSAWGRQALKIQFTRLAWRSGH
ncbi:DUF4123 domain-containing protein [Halocynthiibacter namhaensis]|uniref:DUF4123 domain-containing protein n=1 Tax=Halocynthiibacter namhaensis TaxID=1290553 RepID=UPI000691EB8D|nr:DUF4123 domain-containing protein [Halocynthiibacter namhaensis]